MKLISRLRPDVGFWDIMASVMPGRSSVQKFENAFAEKFENNHAVMFQHGRSGLYVFFKTLGLENAEVICPAYTCVVVPHAIVLSGNIPVFIDCEKGSPNMDIQEIQDSITENTRAIVVTHLFGYPMDVIKVKEMVKDAEQKYGHKIYIIQDVAHSFGAKWNGEMVTKYGDISVFGLNISKTITSIFGGMITSNDTEIDKKIRQYRDEKFKKKGCLTRFGRLVYLKAIWISFNPWFYGFVNFLERKGWIDRFTKYYDEEEIYFPKDWDRLPAPIEAKVGLHQLKKYDKIIQRRTANAQKLIKSFENRDDISFFPHIEGSTYSHCVGKVADRDAWVEAYHKKGYQLGILIEYCIPEMESYKEYCTKAYPVSSEYSRHMVNFPIWLKMK